MLMLYIDFNILQINISECTKRIKKIAKCVIMKILFLIKKKGPVITFNDI